MRSSDLGSQSSDTSRRKDVLITRIRVIDIVSGLRPSPTGFYVCVEIDGKETKTAIQHVLVGKDVIEWDEEIPLPPQLSTFISFRIYALFEPGSGCGDGMLFRQLETTVGEVIDRSEELRSTTLLDKKFQSTRSSLRVATEGRGFNVSHSTARLQPPVARVLTQLERLTDSGYRSLARYRQLHNPRDLDETITCFQRARNMCPTRQPDQSRILFALATTKFIHCQDNNHYHDLNISLSLYQDALHLRNRDQSDRSVTALELCFAILGHLHRQVDDGDSRTEVGRLQSEVMKRYAYQAAWLALQMAGISARIPAAQVETSRVYDGNLADEVIQSMRALLRGMPNPDIGKPVILPTIVDFGAVHYRRFESEGKLDDINCSISLFEFAVELILDGDPQKPARLDAFGESLCRRFESFDNVQDINKSIAILEKATTLTPSGDPERPKYLTSLGIALFHRYGRLGDLPSLEKSVSVFEEALHLTPNGHPDKPARLNNLGNSLGDRFERLGRLVDVDKAVEIFEEAIRLIPQDLPATATVLGGLGKSLRHRFERLGDPNDLNRAISLSEESLHLTSNSHPGKIAQLDSMGGSLLRRFQCLGDIEDIDRSIVTFEQAASLAPNGHPNKPTMLGQLGFALSCRFEHLGDVKDLNKSILVCEEGVQSISDGHPHKPIRLNGLGISLYLRFKRLGHLTDIEKAVTMFERAVVLTPNGHPDKAIWLRNLGNSLFDRYQCHHSLRDLEKSIMIFEEAIHLAPNDKILSTLFNSLGISLLCRFWHLGENGDLNRSIEATEEAVLLDQDGGPHKAEQMMNLGAAFMEYFKHSHDASDLSTPTLHYSTASQYSTAPASTRFTATLRWISAARLQGNPLTLLDAFAVALNILPQLAWLGIPLTERHRVLLEAADVARDAAAAALDDCRPEMAVEWLEQGRSVVWSQFLQLRTPVDELRVKHPVLADQFQQISRQLEYASSRSYSSISSDLSANDSIMMVADGPRYEEDVWKHHELARRREKLFDEIRSLPGFDRFLLPKTIEQLTAFAHSGPVVYLNASKYRCDALIVMENTKCVKTLPLPGISYEDAEFLFSLLVLRNRLVISRGDISALVTPKDSDVAPQRFLDILVGDGVRDGDREGNKIERYNPENRFQLILAFLWKHVVFPVLDALGFSTLPPSSKKLSRIFWCPTGPFAFLPIHAAGLYGTAETGSKLSDFVISSYVPTLGSLGPLTRNDSNPASNIRLVTVPQPSSDGQEKLPCVKAEMDHINSLSSVSQNVSLQQSDGTVEDVMEKMANADWVHFACHGVQDRNNPLDSGLCLAGERLLRLSDIIRLSRPQGGLAFLSACQTAQGDELLSEESVHLAAGMLLAGYGSVIATMWSIMDRDAPKVTKRVYEYLFRDGKVPDSTEAAEALHFAVQELRESGASFSSWVPFIHVGR